MTIHLVAYPRGLGSGGPEVGLPQTHRRPVPLVVTTAVGEYKMLDITDEYVDPDHHPPPSGEGGRQSQNRCAVQTAAFLWRRRCIFWPDLVLCRC